MEEKKVVFVPVNNIIPGMIAANDISDRNNQLIIPKDSVIDGTGITRITLFEITSVTVYADDESAAMNIVEQTFLKTDLLDDSTRDLEKIETKNKEKNNEKVELNF